MSWRDQWLDQLKQSRVVLSLLRDDISGTSPAEGALWTKLQAAIEILDAYITIEEQNLIADRTQ